MAFRHHILRALLHREEEAAVAASSCHDDASAHVHFDSTVAVFSIPSRGQYSEADKARMWFSAEELHLDSQGDCDDEDDDDEFFGSEEDESEIQQSRSSHEEDESSHRRQAFTGRGRPGLRRSDAFEPVYVEEHSPSSALNRRPTLRRSEAFDSC
jgi:hypothetical protein